MKRIFKLILVILVVAISSCNSRTTYKKNMGLIHGTTYSIIYKSENNLHTGIREVMKMTDSLFSTFKPNSVISKFNKNSMSENFPEVFVECMTKSHEISQKTDGSFDPSIAPLINAWGFGNTKKTKVTDQLIDSVMQFVGYKRITISKNNITKGDPRTTINLSAIAKGLSVDRVADHLEKLGITDYLVEIGGEIRTKGKNPKGVYWSVGIDKPIDDVAITNRQIQTIVHLKDVSIATSGNYRNFYEVDGVKYAHTIDPKTGKQIKHTLLSVSVFSKKCMTADAYATAFMVMGLDRSYQLVLNDLELEAYFIYGDKDGKIKIKYTEGVKKFLEE